MAEKKDEGKGAMRKLAKRAGTFMLFALAAVSLVMVVTMADCGCKEEEEAKSDGPIEVQQETNQETAAIPEGKSPSESAIESALRNGKPVFLNFHSNQCIPCIEMEKVIEEVEPEYAGRLEFVVVDVYDPSELALCDYFQVRVIPTSFFIDAGGMVVDAYEGLIDASRMRVLLDGLVAGTLGRKTTP